MVLRVPKMSRVAAGRCGGGKAVAGCVQAALILPTAKCINGRVCLAQLQLVCWASQP